MSDRRTALLKSVLVLDPGIDWKKLPLDAHEGFVLSRIDGTCSVQTLGAMVKMTDDAVVTAIEKLLKLKVVHFKGTPPPSAAAAKPVEKNDLTDEQQDHIFQLHDALGKLTHYDVLKIPRTATHGDVKPAYYAFSKEYHPDRFYGKQLGSYKVMLDRIFKAGKQAYELLSDAAQRATYDRGLPKDASAVINPTLNDVDAKRAGLEAHRQKILSERKSAQKNPFSEQVKMAKGHADQGEALFRTGDLVGAVGQFALALAFDPHNDQHQRRHAELQPLANDKRAQALADQAASEQKNGNFQGAAALYRQAFEMQPGSGKFAARSADLYLQQGTDLGSAREMGEAAVERAPNNPDYKLILAQVFEKTGEMAKAREHLKAAMALGLDNDVTKKLSKRLK